MSYEEIYAGITYERPSPDARHELICGRLHAAVTAALDGVPTARLLEPRSVVEIIPGTVIRPDLALVTAATGKIWLAAEVIGTIDHKIDTVLKKEVYEQASIPRLWMVDPRYDNLEVYQSGQYGLALKTIMAGREKLTEKLLPALSITIAEIFAAATG
ncbi:MAG: Uma2 family endonuclease [Verrucomicrobiota bacterium]